MHTEQGVLRGSDGAESTAAFLRGIESVFRGHRRVSWTGGAMEQEFDSPDLSEFIAACAKRFCPECGKPIEPNRTGRPRSFCSNRCRWAFNKRRTPQGEGGNYMKTAELKVLPVKELKPAAYNPRKKLKPGDKEYQKIKDSIEEFGFADPLVVNSDMTIIGGHQRLTVAMDLGYTEVPCAVVDVDKVREKALNIALNKITGSWDETCWPIFLKTSRTAISILAHRFRAA
jgi:hypothetical protein